MAPYTLADFPLRVHSPRPALGQGIVLPSNALLMPSPVPDINCYSVLLACELWRCALEDARRASARRGRLLPPPPPTPPADFWEDLLAWTTPSSPAAEN